MVGDEAILRSDVEAARMEFGSNITGNPYCVIPEQLAVQKLFLHQAQLDSVEVDNSQISASMEARLSELVMRAGSKEKYEPSIIARYVIALATAFNKFYHERTILQADDKEKRARLLLTDLVQKILCEACGLLGMECPDEM